MGHIVKKIVGDVDKDPDYNNLTVEDNKSRIVHIHVKNLRLDLNHDAYNELVRGLRIAHEKLNKK